MGAAAATIRGGRATQEEAPVSAAIRRLASPFLVLAIAVLVVAACRRETPPATPAPAPETVVEPSWPRIERSGELVVGTSADYPPFAYFNEDFRIDGLDAALIRAVGEKLGTEVVLRDFAFDGLAEALHVGQIDAAIAAISVTPERQSRLAFTQAYFVGEDAMLVPSDSAVTVTRIEDLASLRVGVQSGSVYESALKKQLVDTGMMLPTQLFSYARIDQAVADLGAGRLGAVVLDLQPAQTFARSDALRIAAQGLNRQRFAIALRPGDGELLARMDEALQALQADGTLARLVQEHVGQEQTTAPPVPTETPGPTSTPLPPPPCMDAMELVEDVTFDDRDMTAPPTIDAGRSFVKTWRVRNTGTCAWSTSYALRFVRGNAPGADMGGVAVPVPGDVPPGQTVDISVNLVAPLVPGVYQGLWQLFDAYGEAFGQTVSVGVIVPIPATPTPAPTQTPVPGILFSVDRTSVPAGQCVEFRWRVDNARMVYLYPAGSGYTGRDVAPEGVRSECPTSTTTYVLRAELLSGAVEERHLTVVVDHVDGLPAIAELRAEPARIGVDGCVEVSWDVWGNASTVTVTRDGGALWNNAPLRASTRDCPPGRGEVAYRVEATGPGGTARAQVTVRIE